MATNGYTQMLPGYPRLCPLSVIRSQKTYWEIVFVTRIITAYDAATACNIIAHIPAV